MEETKMVPAPEEALTPREVRLERGAAVLRWGAVLNGAAGGLFLLLGFIAGIADINGVNGALKSLLVPLYSGADAAGLAIACLLMLVNISALLVAMVGALARELWTALALVGIIVGNIALLLIFGFTPGIVTLVAALAAGILLGRDPGAFRVNPVMLKELRGRMRGIRAFMVITIYLALMSALAVLLYLVQAQANQFTGTAAGGIIGRVLFVGIVGIELLLIIFIAPSFTAGAITGERERKTYDLLQTTLLASPSFVIGKLESALSYVLLLLLSAIPLQSIAFLFGGVSEVEVLLAFAILAVTAVGLGTVGLFFSTTVERTLSASVRAYSVALVITFGVPVVLVVLLTLIQTFLNGLQSAGALTPAAETLFFYLRDFLISLNPIATVIRTQDLLVNQGQIGFGVQTLASTGATIPTVSPWITFTIIYLVLSALLVVLSVRRMRRIEA